MLFVLKCIFVYLFGCISIASVLAIFPDSKLNTYSSRFQFFLIGVAALPIMVPAVIIHIFKRDGFKEGWKQLWKKV